MILRCIDVEWISGTQDAGVPSGVPAVDQTFTSKCHETKGLTTNNSPGAKRQGQ